MTTPDTIPPQDPLSSFRGLVIMVIIHLTQIRSVVSSYILKQKRPDCGNNTERFPRTTWTR